jgi:hypothetical protein
VKFRIQQTRLTTSAVVDNFAACEDSQVES